MIVRGTFLLFIVYLDNDAHEHVEKDDAEKDDHQYDQGWVGIILLLLGLHVDTYWGD